MVSYQSFGNETLKTYETVHHKFSSFRHSNNQDVILNFSFSVHEFDEFSVSKLFGLRSWYIDSLPPHQYSDQTPGGGGLSAPIQTGLWAHPVSYKTGTGSF